MDENRLQVAKKASIQGAITSLIFATVKIVIGIKGNSSALLADGLHTAGDVGISYIMFKGFVIANKPADDKYNYGYAKAEAVTAKVLALILVVMAVLAGKSALANIFSPHPEESSWLAVGVVALTALAKEYMFRHGVHLAKSIKSNAMMVEAWHNRNAALTSLAVMAGLIGARLGLPILDPITGLAVAGLILWAAVKLYLNALKDLMDSAPEPEIYAHIVNATTTTPGVENIHGVKARRNGHAVHVDMKMCVPSETSVAASYAIANLAKANIIGSHEDIKEAVIEVKPCFKDIRKASCQSCPRFLEEQIRDKECDQPEDNVE